jgi:predicted glycogen debranching enzyme
LLLVTARFEDAQKVFLSFTDHFRQGLIPNLLGDGTEESAYNAVDASLWYVNAVFQYLKYTGDFEFVKTRLWETVKSIINGYSRGTLFQICQDRDGLLSHGAQLTWMDAVVDGEPVTPRGGKAVEIQTLWYNALKITELLADRYEDRSLAEKYGLMAEKTRGSFVEEFWNSEKGCLFDVLSDTQKDGSLRPNQVLAVGLDFSMLGKAQSEKVVDVVRRELLTPYGLRTLNRNDRRYVGVYSGGRRSRDSAYHNGTVWPWLLGPFVTAYMKVNGYSESVRDCVKGFLVPLFSEQILRAGLGTVSEIFDGDAPFAPRGCISQAWSVAEPLRAYFEDVILNRPKYEKEVLRSLG